MFSYLKNIEKKIVLMVFPEKKHWKSFVWIVGFEKKHRKSFVSIVGFEKTKKNRSFWLLALKKTLKIVCFNFYKHHPGLLPLIHTMVTSCSCPSALINPSYFCCSPKLLILSFSSPDRISKIARKSSPVTFFVGNNSWKLEKFSFNAVIVKN